MSFLRDLKEMLIETTFVPIAFVAAAVIMLPMISDPKFLGSYPTRSKVIAFILISLAVWLISGLVKYFYQIYYKFYFGGYSNPHNRTLSEKKALLDMTTLIADKASMIFNRKIYAKRDVQFIGAYADSRVAVFCIDLSDPTDLADPANFRGQSPTSVFSLHCWVANDESLVEYVNEQLNIHISRFPQLTPPQITYGRVDESLTKTGTIQIRVVNPKNNVSYFPKQQKLLKDSQY